MSTSETTTSPVASDSTTDVSTDRVNTPVPVLVIDLRGTPAHDPLADEIAWTVPDIDRPVDEIVSECRTLADQHPHHRICCLLTHRVHIAEDRVGRFEARLSEQLQTAIPGVIVLRSGVVLPTEGLPQSLRWLAPVRPLIPRSLRSVFVSQSVIDDTFRTLTDPDRLMLPDGESRALTVLGENRPLLDVVRERGTIRFFGAIVFAIASVLGWLQVHRLIGGLLGLASRFAPGLKRWWLTTLEPTSRTELLSLYNPLNRPFVALAGNNMGVVHFGWKYPGRTVVRTTSIGTHIELSEGSAENSTVTVDAGALLKDVVLALSERERELYVVPNYSYVSMGTTFMVPVHGSGSEVSTLGDTIEQVELYDPETDRVQVVNRAEALFDACMYNPASGALALRLTLRTRPKSRYFVRQENLTLPDAETVWKIFDDREASNIELRKSDAADETVEVSRYYHSPADDGTTTEIPRDKLGRLWDRLESNAITAWGFHLLVRKIGFHVELFLDRDQFETFWASHRDLPLKKIQLRYVHRDGLTHSPFGDRDCISADIFMSRGRKDEFLAFMREHLPDARFNPGKHSM